MISAGIYIRKCMSAYAATGLNLQVMRARDSRNHRKGNNRIFAPRWPEWEEASPGGGYGEWRGGGGGDETQPFFFSGVT